MAEIRVRFLVAAPLYITHTIRSITMVDFPRLLSRLDKSTPNSRKNPLGLKKLDLTHNDTIQLVLNGNYIDINGNIFDTTIWPNDLVQLTENSQIITLWHYTEYQVTSIISDSYSSAYFRKAGFNYTFNVCRAMVYVNGRKYRANNFTSLQGVKKMTLAIEKTTPTFVREFTDAINSSGDVERSYIGTQIEFKTLGAAKNFVSTEISNSIRTTNAYRKFAIFQEVYTAQVVLPLDDSPICIICWCSS